MASLFPSHGAAAGAAMVEPVIAAARTQEQAEYGMFEALGNIAFGAAFGAALHPAAGAVGDWLRGRRGQRHPWEFSSPTPDTLVLKDAHAQAIYEARFAADPGMDTARLTQEAHAAASLFDARARAWAHDTGRAPEEYYEAYRPQYQAADTRAGFEGPDLYQDRAISVSGKEIGVPGGASLKEYQKAAREIYRDLQKTPAYRDDLGQIQFTGAGFGEMKKTGADARKWMLVPKLKEIIERAEYIQRKEADKQRRDRVVAFHWLEADVKLDGTLLRVGVHVAEDASGNKFYNLNQDLVSWAEKYRTPDNHSGQSTPEARELFQDENSSGEKTVSTDGEEVNIHILRSVPQSGTPRASVSFDADGRAVVDFFASADFSSAPHELYHVFRREMEQTAGMADVPARVRENWNRILEFVGAEPGQRWTRDMEEKFARAGERFLLEGKAPTPELHGVFEKMRQWFLELFADADASGLEISDSMRRVFGDMLTTPMEHGDANFRYALGSLLERTFAEDADTRLPEQPDLDKMPLEAVRALADEEMRNLDAHWQQMSQAHPEAAKIIGDDYRAEVLAAEAEEAAAIRNREILDAIVDCELRRGTR